MTSPVRLFACLMLLLPGCSVPEPAGPSQPVHEIIDESKVPVPMRDGVNLAAHVYRPDAPGKFPTLMLLRYFRAPFQNEHAEYFAKRGYAVALVDSRGRYDSGGKWVPYVNEPRDGYDAQQWLGQQPWSNGEIGTMGISYNGFTQVMPAPLGSPHLKCLVPRENQQTNFGHLYNDGVMQLNVVFEFGLFTKQGSQTQKILPSEDPHYRRLPLIAAVDEFPQVEHVKDWFAHAKYDEYWQAYGIKEKYGQIKVPAYFMTGWYDNLVHEGWRNFKGFTEEGGSEAARKGTKILVGPWVHGGTNSYPELLDVELRWYDFWLEGIRNGIDKEPPIKIFVMGPDIWRFENEWPLARTRYTKYYIRSSGKANGDQGDGTLASSPAQDESPDRYAYDPERPGADTGRADLDSRGDSRAQRQEFRSEPQGHSGLHLGTAGSGHGSHRAGRLQALRRLQRRGHRLDGDVERPASRRPGDSRLRGDPGRALPGWIGDSDVDRAGRGLRVRHQPLGDELRFQGGAPDPLGGLQQQLSPVCPKPEYRRAVGDERPDRRGQPDRLPQRSSTPPTWCSP